MMRFLSLICLLLFQVSAQARVFSFKDAGIAPFFRVTGGLSSVNQDPFIHSSGAGTVIDDETKFSYSGELGFVLSLMSSLNLRVGAELIQHRPVTDGLGQSPALQQRFLLDSAVEVFNPNVTLEAVLSSFGNTRVYALAGVGMADVTVENEYRMTAGNDLGIANDFTEKMSGKNYSSHAGFGVETLFADNATFSLDIGYRYLPISDLKYKGQVNNIVSPGGVNEGDQVLNANGTVRKLNLSGVIMGLMLRFYF